MSQPNPLLWKARQLWLKAKCMLSPSKATVYQLMPRVRFVAHLDDLSSHDIYIKRNYESKEIQWCNQWLQDGDAFVDCGANIGFYAACLAQLKKLSKIVAVEGNETCFERCSKTFNLLSLEEITLLHAILHSDTGQSFCIPDMPGQEGLQHISPAPDAGTQTLALDELVEREGIQPSLIKVDCEGAETEILKSASHLLEKMRPAWLVEINDSALARSGTSRAELFQIFKDAAYRIYHISSAFAVHPAGIEIDCSFESWSFNMAAIPDDPVSHTRWAHSIQQL